MAWWSPERNHKKMGWLFSNTKTHLSRSSRVFHRTECPDEPEERDRVISNLTRAGHRVTGYLNNDAYQPMPEQPRKKRSFW
jgi:hypothetical protein